MIDPDDFDALAAECALGSLEGEERDAALRLRAVDPAFNAAVQAWERRLSPLLETIPDLDPPAELFSRIERRLAEPTLAHSRRLFPRERRIQAAIVALAACLVLALGLWSALRPQRTQFSGVLAESSGAQGFRLVLDPTAKALTAVPLKAPRLAGRSYELWLVAAGARPLAYGLLDPGHATSTQVRGDVNSAERALWAVTIEPDGGSPTGQPTGSIVFQGRLAPT